MLTKVRAMCTVEAGGRILLATAYGQANDVGDARRVRAAVS
jgi:hypothetical protein